VLGAWVWHLRRAGRRGELPAWQVQALDALRFEWDMPPAECAWHCGYHALRRFRLLHGTADVPPGWRDPHDRLLSALPRWLRKQAKLFGKERLPAAKARMLAALGVALRLPEGRVRQYARLRGLNGHERKLERRRWKAAERAEGAALAAERGALEAREAARAGAAAVTARRRALLEGARRRELLLRAGGASDEAAGGGGGGGGGGGAAEEAEALLPPWPNAAAAAPSMPPAGPPPARRPRRPPILRRGEL